MIGLRVKKIFVAAAVAVGLLFGMLAVPAPVHAAVAPGCDKSSFFLSFPNLV